MPTVEKTSGGRVYVRLVGQEFSVGDRAEVSADEAAYLCDERGDFERVGDDDVGDDFSANGWLENDYQERADAVLEGGLDDYLGEIEEAETSETVIDAVEQRRAELEG